VEASASRCRLTSPCHTQIFMISAKPAPCRFLSLSQLPLRNRFHVPSSGPSQFAGCARAHAARETCPAIRPRSVRLNGAIQHLQRDIGATTLIIASAERALETMWRSLRKRARLRKIAGRTKHDSRVIADSRWRLNKRAADAESAT